MKVFKYCLLLLLFPTVIQAQSDPVVVTIDKYNITKSEFLRTYNKNNQPGTNDNKSVQEYMDLFVNYKLKVVEAEHLGYDTAASFISEFKSYREQLAKPYLVDASADEAYMKEVYNYMLEEIRARHIFIKVGTLASAADTLKAYNKALEAIAELKKGNPWDTVVTKYSEDSNVGRNKGDLGFFTAFQMIYPFEKAAYALKVGEISKPVRSGIGYHVIELLERRPSKGELKVAHIMASFPENSSPSSVDSVKNIIGSIYKRLQAGEDFATLAKEHSDDRRSAQKGGELNWFGVNSMIPEFENAAFALSKNGDISTPIRTTFGYHIIKRLDMRPISAYDSVKNMIKQRLSRDERSKAGQNALVAKIKREIAFKDAPEKALLLVPIIDSTLYTGQWKASKADGLKKEVLFTINKKVYTVRDFADFFVLNHRQRKPVDAEALVKKVYKDFVDQKIIEFENSRLDQKYPEFKALIQEYHDGILLFNLMEEKIWSQAAKDTVGLEKFYQQRKDTYKWGERVEALVVTSPDKALVEAAYVYAPDFEKNNITAEQIWKKVCPDTTRSCMNCQIVLFEKGDNSILDSIGWEPGITKIVFREGKNGFFVKRGTQPGRLKTYDEAKGTTIADYQEYLEKQYLEQMRKKYKVVINQQVLSSIKP